VVVVSLGEGGLVLTAEERAAGERAEESWNCFVEERSNMGICGSGLGERICGSALEEGDSGGITAAELARILGEAGRKVVGFISLRGEVGPSKVAIFGLGDGFLGFTSEIVLDFLGDLGLEGVDKEGISLGSIADLLLSK